MLGYVTINLLVFIGVLYGLYRYLNYSNKLSRTVFMGLLFGILLGGAFQFFYPPLAESLVLQETMQWINVVGSGYVKLLQMIVMPLVFISILSAIAKLHDVGSLGKISVSVIGILLFTTAIAAFIAVFVTHWFGLTAEGLISGTRETAASDRILQYAGQVNNLTVSGLILSFIPKNPFLELTGANPTSIVSVVIFSVFLGVATLKVHKENSEIGKNILQGIDSLNKLIMTLVRMIIRLTPYGVFALIIKVVASSNLADISNLLIFIVASYFAQFLMFIVHGLLLSLSGLNPLRYFKKVFSTLIFAFTSRSSAGTIPLNIETQINKLGNFPAIANFSASFGATIGQNGCAGIYPAMLAVMIAPTLGINPIAPQFLFPLVALITISSLGIAGVGGGGTFAAIIVLSALGFPLELVGLLISIEPLIDMGRTALNVNGAMLSGTLTSRWLKQQNNKIWQKE